MLIDILRTAWVNLDKFFVRGIRESAGPTNLTLGAVADGEFLKRSGSTIIGGAAGGGGGSSATYGTATLNFGTGSGSNEATVAVTGQAAILVTSKAEAFIAADDTSVDHTAADHRYAPALGLALTCGTPTAGVGFSIYGRCAQRLHGNWAVRWRWEN